MHIEHEPLLKEVYEKRRKVVGQIGGRPFPKPSNSRDDDKKTARKNAIAERLKKMGGKKKGMMPQIPAQAQKDK